MLDYQAYLYCIDGTNQVLFRGQDRLDTWFQDPWPPVVVLEMCDLPSKLPVPYSPRTKLIKIVSCTNRTFNIDRGQVPNLDRVICEGCTINLT